MHKPNFFIVGAPKCGTTAMNDYLGQHPDIFMAVKELHYFGSDLKTKVKISEAEYLRYFQNAGNKKIIGDASVWYLFSQKASEEIKNFSPEAKILIMLRNPVEVIHSLHSQNLYDGNEDIFDFEKAVSLDEERKKGINLPDSLDFFELPPYKDSVLFSAQVKRYLDIFDKKKIRIVLYDDFVTDTKKVVTETFEFLEVNAEKEINYKVINPNKQIQSFYLHRLLKNPSPKLKKMVRLILPVRKTRHTIMSRLFKWNTRIKKRTEVSNRLNNELKSFFADDIIALSRIINRDLSGWM